MLIFNLNGILHRQIKVNMHYMKRICPALSNDTKFSIFYSTNVGVIKILKVDMPRQDFCTAQLSKMAAVSIATELQNSANCNFILKTSCYRLFSVKTLPKMCTVHF